ncbi:MAG: nuclear transport factor 2 family protein [Pseudomonadota bacterium]
MATAEPLSPDDRARILGEVYAAAREGRWDDLAAFVTDDFTIYEADALPYGGAWRGKDAFERLYPAVMGTWADPEAETLEIAGGKEWVLAVVRLTMTSKKTGRRFSQTVCEAGTFEGGLLKDLRIHYFDAAEVASQA